MVNPRTIARLEARIHERAAYCLQFEVSDPRASFITITRVKLSPDITSGRIYYSVLGGPGDKTNAEHMLKSAAGFIQRQVSRVLSVRRMPHLSWQYDDSLENAANIDALIREARARDAELNPEIAAELAAQDLTPSKAASAGADEDDLGADDDLEDDFEEEEDDLDLDEDEPGYDPGNER
jgi:ribosome-binding factor A